MTYLNHALIRDCLGELSDKSFQQRIWMASSGPEVSSFTEAVCQLFDDSGLDLALNKGSAFGNPIDDLLKQLQARLAEIPHDAPPMNIINDEKMVIVRDIASHILKIMKTDSADTMVK